MFSLRKILRMLLKHISKHQPRESSFIENWYSICKIPTEILTGVSRIFIRGGEGIAFPKEIGSCNSHFFSGFNSLSLFLLEIFYFFFISIKFLRVDTIHLLIQFSSLDLEF